MQVKAFEEAECGILPAKRSKTEPGTKESVVFDTLKDKKVRHPPSTLNQEPRTSARNPQPETLPKLRGEVTRGGRWWGA